MSSSEGRKVGLRQSTLRGRRSRKGKGGGGWRGNWKDRFNIPRDELTPILLTDGDYPAPDDSKDKFYFHTCKMHKMRLAPKGAGSFYSDRCALDYGEVDCLPCFAKDRGDRRVGLNDNFSFNILHLALYAKKEVLDRDGRVKRYERDTETARRGDPIRSLQVVETPREIREIREGIGNKLEQKEVALFKKKYLEVGANHRDDLARIADEAAKFCRCGGDLTPVCFVCEECESEVLSSADLDDMKASEVSKFRDERQTCSHCGHTGFPDFESACSDCDEPEALSAFEVVAFVKKEGESTGTHIVVKEVIPVTEFELADGSSLIDWEEDEEDDDNMVPCEDDDGNYVWTEENGIRKAITSQWDFNSIHKPRDHAFHSRKLNVDVPRDFTNHSFSSPSGGRYRNYRGGSSGGAPRSDEEPQERAERQETASRKPARKTGRRRRRRRE